MTLDRILDMTLEQIDFAVRAVETTRARRLQQVIAPVYTALTDKPFKGPRVGRRSEQRRPRDPAQREAMLDFGLAALGIPVEKKRGGA